MQHRRLALPLLISALSTLAACELVVDPDKGGLAPGGGGSDDDTSDTDVDPVQPDDGEDTTGADSSGDDDTVVQTGCAAVLCVEGTSCVETDHGPACLAPDDNPCESLACPLDRICSIQEGEAVCTLVDNGDGTDTSGDGSDSSGEGDGGSDGSDSSGEDPCNLTDCPPDRPVCTAVGGEAVCSAYTLTCATATCPADTYCDDVSGDVQCIPLPSCDDLTCGKGEACVLEDVECVRAPCPQQPTCIADACATHRCGFGYHCELNTTLCVSLGLPCTAAPVCVADSPAAEPCDDVTCGSGEECCDASCAACGTAGACSDRACAYSQGTSS